MKRRFPHWPALGLAAIAILALAGCTKSQRSAYHAHRADSLYRSGKYDAAEIECFRALSQNTNNGAALSRLGIIYLDDGRFLRAGSIIMTAAKLDPDNLELKLNQGRLYQRLGQYTAAAIDARAVLQRDPDSAEAPLLLVQSATSPSEREAAANLLRSLPEGAANRAPVLMALAAIAFSSHDNASAGRLTQQALTQDPHYAAAYSLRALLDLQRKDPAAAGADFARAAQEAPWRSSRRLQYATFAERQGQPELARTILQQTVAAAPDFLPAVMQLASLEETTGDLKGALASAISAVQRDSIFPGAALLAGQLCLRTHANADAEKYLTIAVQNYGRDPQVQLEYARAELTLHKVTEAVTALNAALRDAPDFTDAALDLAQLQMVGGDVTGAILTLQKFLAKRPDVPAATYLLGVAYVDQGNFEPALGVYRRLESYQPKDPRARVLTGEVLRRLNDDNDARDEFEAALAIAPGNLDALEQLSALDLDHGNGAGARARVQRQIARQPKSGQLQMLRGRICLAMQDYPDAVAALQSAIALEPNLTDSYYLLAEYYADTKREAQASRELAALVKAQPADNTAWMMLGLLAEHAHRWQDARADYQRATAANADFFPALNNLAYLDAEYFHDLDGALAVATHAREVSPEEAHGADTLGWIQYKRGHYDWALSLLQESASRMPGDADNEVHLGMTQYMLGQEGPARLNLARGVAGKPDIPEIADARDILGVLAIDPDHPAPSDRALLERVLAQRPADPGALTRLAGLYESVGEHSKAIETAQSVLKANPQHLGSWVVLAKARAQSGDETGAMDAAKHAHDLAPDDPQIDHLVGSLALAAHNYPWAYSVLKDAANQGGGNDAGLQSDFSRAAYSQGHVDEALHAAELSVRQDGDSARAAATERFIKLVHFAAKPDADHAAEIELLIGQDPNSVAALMAQGSIDELQMRPDAARDHFRRALDSFPAFAPADRRLVLLARDDDSLDAAAEVWATAAREAYPDDPVLASAGGIIAFRSHEYRRAVTLLSQGLAAQPDDGDALYCLGMAQFQLKDPSARSTLRRALNLKLRPQEATEVRRILGEASGL